MSSRIAVRLVVAGLASLAPALQAQELADPGRDRGALASQAARPCRTCSLWALRGTYTFTATAWQNLSEINPALPGGYAPVTIIGAFRVDGNGELTGWAAVNAGGLQLAAEFVDSRFSAPGADRSFAVSLSMRIKEFGEAVAGPYSYVGVVASDAPAALEIALMMRGTGPGSHVELNHAKRVSMDFD